MTINRKMDRLKHELVAEKGHSVATVNRLFRLVDRFATSEAFFNATKTMLMKAWNEENPNGTHDLGSAFYRCYDDAVRFWNTDSEPTPDPAECVLSKEQVKKVLDFMEMFEKPSISVSEIQSLLTMTEAGK